MRPWNRGAPLPSDLPIVQYVVFFSCGMFCIFSHVRSRYTTALDTASLVKAVLHFYSAAL